jgi:hypothetical protein
MSDVFISYSHVDEQIVRQIAAELKGLGLAVFLDRKDIQWGDDIQDRVSDGLSSCAALLVVVSPASLKSWWVPYEIDHTRALCKLLLPFVTHPALELPASLSSLAHIGDLDGLRGFFSKVKLAARASEVSKVLNETTSKVVAAAPPLPPTTPGIEGTWVGTGNQPNGPDGAPINFDVLLTLRVSQGAIEGGLAIEMPFHGRQYRSEFDVSGGVVSRRFGWLNYVGRDPGRPHFGTLIADVLREPGWLVANYVGYGALTQAVVYGFTRLRRVPPPESMSSPTTRGSPPS